MIEKLEVKNFTVFRDASFEFGRRVNILVGANGAGKTHILKLLYAFTQCGRQKQDASQEKEDFMTGSLFHLLGSVFLSDVFELISHSSDSMELTYMYEEDGVKNEIRCEAKKLRSSQREGANPVLKGRAHALGSMEAQYGNYLPIREQPLFLPARELLSIFPGFLSLSAKYQLPYDQTYRDTVTALGMLPLKDDYFSENPGKTLYSLIEKTLGGTVYLGGDWNHFYLKLHDDDTQMEINLAAEGWRKLGMLMVLLRNGSIVPGMALFWDEPEANQNPKLICLLAKVLIQLSNLGVQVFLTTHSLFLLKELDMLVKKDKELERGDVRYFNFLKPGEVEQGNAPEDLTDILLLDESLAQSDRYMQMED